MIKNSVMKPVETSALIELKESLRIRKLPGIFFRYEIAEYIAYNSAVNMLHLLGSLDIN